MDGHTITVVLTANRYLSVGMCIIIQCFAEDPAYMFTFILSRLFRGVIDTKGDFSGL